MFINRDTICFIQSTLLFNTLFSVIAHKVGIVIQLRLNTTFFFFFSHQNAQLNILLKLSAMNTDLSGNYIPFKCFRLLTTESPEVTASIALGIGGVNKSLLFLPQQWHETEGDEIFL